MSQVRWERGRNGGRKRARHGVVQASSRSGKTFGLVDWRQRMRKKREGWKLEAGFAQLCHLIYLSEVNQFA
jgi:hypothetical protein